MKNISPKLLILVFFLISPRLTQALPAKGDSLQPVSLPSLSALEEATLRRAGLDPSVIHQWQRNVRRAAALPRFQVGFDQKAQQQNTAVVQDSISVTSAGVSIGPASNRLDQDFGSDRGFEVKAVWALDELLFNRDELEVSREARDLLVMRSQLIQDLHQSYYELKTQLTRLQMDPVLAQDPLEKLKTEQLMDKIDSLSGGEFKKLLGDKK